ncbi:MAG: hypothetical protein U0S48_08885 [Solirubrobacteraceae bacterium]
MVEAPAADRRGLEDRVLATRDRGDLEQRVAVRRPVAAGVLAVGPLGVHPIAVDVALEHDLGIGRDQQVDGLAAHERHGGPAQRAHHRELVRRRHAHLARHVVERVGADDEGDLEAPPGLASASVVAAQVRRGDHVDAGLVRPPQHEPANAGVVAPGVRVAADVHRRRDVGRAVELVLQVGRQPRQIDLVADLPNRLDRAVVHLDGVDRPHEALCQLAGDLGRGDAEGDRPARSRGHRVGQQRHVAALRALDQHRLVGGLRDPRHVAQRRRPGNALELAGAVERFDEAAQALGVGHLASMVDVLAPAAAPPDGRRAAAGRPRSPPTVPRTRSGRVRARRHSWRRPVR